MRGSKKERETGDIMESRKPIILIVRIDVEPEMEAVSACFRFMLATLIS